MHLGSNVSGCLASQDGRLAGLIDLSTFLDMGPPHMHIHGAWANGKVWAGRYTRNSGNGANGFLE